MTNPLKTLFFSIRQLLWSLQNDFRWVLTLSLFGFAVIVCGDLLFTQNWLGLVPFTAFFVIVIRLADRVEGNRDKLNRLAECQVTTERHNRAIREYFQIPSVNQKALERKTKAS
jgi:hypothetical protein